MCRELAFVSSCVVDLSAPMWVRLLAGSFAASGFVLFVAFWSLRSVHYVLSGLRLQRSLSFIVVAVAVTERSNTRRNACWSLD